MLPHDIKELARQSLFHELQHEMHSDYHCAQFSDDNIPKKVLDIGCGTGIWCASVAQEFAERGQPNVEFVGLDVVPVYGDMKGVNFTFVRHDFTSNPMPFPDNEFDYIFMRDVSWGVKSGLFYTDLFHEYFRVLKPGGAFEIQCSM
jgi:ubiquinone/menaquinone biosynthesis C-methylase UbiE